MADTVRVNNFRQQSTHDDASYGLVVAPVDADARRRPKIAVALRK
jgi:hypothetical protein